MFNVCMKNRCRNIFKMVGVFLLGLLVFSSCTKQEPDSIYPPYGGQGALAYGSPVARYKVSGKVFTNSGKPIEGIKVNVMFTTIYTAGDGSFSGEVSYYPRDNVTISFTDVDGDKYQGEFQSLSVNVTPKQTGKGDGSWFQGTYSVSTTVRMNKK